jgi:hypothetical protein
MDLREVGWEVLDWMHLAQDRDQWRALVSTVMNIWGYIKAGEFPGRFLKKGSTSQDTLGIKGSEMATL